MIVLKLVIFMLFISVHHCRVPDKVYCVNEECSGEFQARSVVMLVTFLQLVNYMYDFAFSSNI